MIRNIRLSKIFWNITAAFALLAALPGSCSRMFMLACLRRNISPAHFRRTC